MVYLKLKFIWASFILSDSTWHLSKYSSLNISGNKELITF